MVDSILQRELLKKKLLQIEAEYVSGQEIENDPIAYVLRFPNKADQEVVAFIAAAFSYGNVKQIQKTLNTIFILLGERPALKLLQTEGKDWKQIIPSAFKHRFNTADDLGCLLTWLGQALKSYGSLENLFCVGLENPQDLHLGLENFIDRITSLSPSPYRPKNSKGVHFFFSRPSNKSACKRLLLFLRWVVRTGPMDLGIWKKISPSSLIIPVDTHVLRISRHLGLTKRKDNSWRTAQEITAALKKMDAEDPVRFDFALCHLGISKECPSRFNKNICPACRMNTLCLTYNRILRRSATLPLALRNSRKSKSRAVNA